jgi:hypothetical protein
MTPEERIYPMFTERVKPMSLREEVAAIRPGDTVTVRFEHTDQQGNKMEFDITGVAWKTVGRGLCVGDRYVRYGDGDIAPSLTKVVNRIPGKPEWHDAQVIKAVVAEAGISSENRYLINDRETRPHLPWAYLSNGSGYHAADEQLSNVVIIVDKDGNTRA